MPKWICTECEAEFWGWSVYHGYRSGKAILCPNCKGNLVREGELTGANALDEDLHGTVGF